MIYIGNFFHLTNQQELSDIERRHGEFNLLVDADSQEKALALFKKRIVDFKKTGSLFEGECRIFLVKLMALSGIPKKEAVMINFKSIAGDPILPFIDCAIPTDDTDNCKIFEWKGNTPEIEGIKGELFITFQD
jgi:hypothetical protein